MSEPIKKDVDLSGTAKAYSSDADLHARQGFDPECDDHDWQEVDARRSRCRKCGMDRAPGRASDASDAGA